MKSEKLSLGSISVWPAEILTRTFYSWGNSSVRAFIFRQKPHFAKFLLIVVLLSCGAVRAEEDAVPADQTPTIPETPAETAPQKSSIEDAVWPRPFKPSEEIGADSQVSFPTDI